MHTYAHLYASRDDLNVFMMGIKNKLKSSNDWTTLIQLYLTESDFHSLKDIKNSILGYVPDAHLLGLVSNDNIYTDGTVHQQSMVVISMFKNATINVFAFDDLSLNRLEFGRSLVKRHCTKHSKLLMLYSNIPCFNCEDTINGVKSLATNLYISGATIPFDQGQQLFTDQVLVNQGIIGFVIDSVNLVTNAYSNYIASPIGKQHIITDSQGQFIKSIDHIPARDFYTNYIGQFNNDSLERIGYHFPLLLNHHDRLHPKKIINITEEGYLMTNTKCHPGDVVSIGYSNIKKVCKDANDALEIINGFPIETAFIFIGKKRYQRTSNFIQYKVSEHFGAVVGFLTHSEFIQTDDTPIVGIGSFSMIAISESDTLRSETSHAFTLDCNFKEEDLALLNVVDNTTHELNIINRNLESVIKHKTDALKQQFYTDQLTKLPNDNRLKSHIKEKNVESLALIDISSFIHINNFYGNHISNQLLQELSYFIDREVRDLGCRTYRVHSDIFAVTTKDVEETIFDTLIKRLQESIHRHTFMNLSLDIQLSTVVVISHSKVHIYDHAFMTLEHAKGNKVDFLIYDSDLQIETSIQNNLIWASRIQSAIANDRVVPYYQPIYNNNKKRVDHYEVLMRLIGEDGTVYTPKDFLDIAKKANLYKPMTRIIIKKAMDYFKDTPNNFSINLTSADMLDTKNRAYIIEQTVNYTKPEKIIFEIVESESIANYDVVRDFIRIIKSYGASIAIDDFGTGFSNFMNLFKLDVDIIKIDGSIIQAINHETAALSVAETIVDFATKMNILTVAEFVSDKFIFDTTVNLGIDYAQGYYVAKPSKDIRTYDFAY